MVCSAVVIAAQIQYLQHGWINRDSLYYLESARLLVAGEWHQAIKVFNWPLYSALIAALHKVTGLTLHHSAQVLSVIFFGIATYSFLTIIQLAGGGRKELVAGSLILFSAGYMVGDVLAMLMRDQGFWAFFLASIVFFIRYYKSATYKDAFLWQISAILATLFRIEGITYLLALPITLLFVQQHPFSLRLRNFLRCNFLTIIAGASITMAILISQDMSIQNFGRLNEIFTVDFYHGLTKNITDRSHIMAHDVLGRYLDEYATQGILLIFLYIVITKIILATGIINSGLALASVLSKKIQLDVAAFRVLKATAILSFLNFYLIITKVFVLSGRYVLALSFILMVLASFSLAYLFRYLVTVSTSKKKWGVIILLAFMLVGFAKNIWPKDPSNTYCQDAVVWLREKNKDRKPVFYDDSRIRYYAGVPYIGSWDDNWLKVSTAIKDNTLKPYSFLVISHSEEYIEREKILAEQLPEYREIKRFAGPKSKKSIVIYEKINNE